MDPVNVLWQISIDRFLAIILKVIFVIKKKKPASQMQSGLKIINFIKEENSLWFDFRL